MRDTQLLTNQVENTKKITLNINFFPLRKFKVLLFTVNNSKPKCKDFHVRIKFEELDIQKFSF